MHLFNFITDSHYTTNIFYNLAYCDCSRFSEGQLGVDHPDVATSLNNFAALYHSQGRYEAAEPLYQQALSLRREILGDRHPDVASSLFNLAGALLPNAKTFRSNDLDPACHADLRANPWYRIRRRKPP